MAETPEIVAAHRCLTPEDFLTIRESQTQVNAALDLVEDGLRVQEELRAERDALQAEVRRLREALTAYGQHALPCEIYAYAQSVHRRPSCTCGLVAALQPAEPGDGQAGDRASFPTQGTNRDGGSCS